MNNFWNFALHKHKLTEESSEPEQHHFAFLEPNPEPRQNYAAPQHCLQPLATVFLCFTIQSQMQYMVCIVLTPCVEGV
jgi:hypothetical protein